jgi:sugar diacid utilization regulator
LKTAEQKAEEHRRQEFVQKLITIDWQNEDLAAVAQHLGLEYDEAA